MTFDPTTNRVPWHLLTEDEKKAMQAAEHGWVRWFFITNPASWRDTDNPAWNNATIYRAKPAPKEVPASIDWSHVSEDVVAIAQDDNGDWVMFDSIPKPIHNGWWEAETGSVGDATIFASFDPGSITDWRKTLIMRPGCETEGGK